MERERERERGTKEKNGDQRRDEKTDGRVHLDIQGHTGSVLDLQSQSSKEKRSEENKKHFRGETKGRGPESRHAPPATSTGIKIQKVLQQRSSYGKCAFLFLQRETMQ